MTLTMEARAALQEDRGSLLGDRILSWSSFARAMAGIPAAISVDLGKRRNES
jgi:hypothetical protein